MNTNRPRCESPANETLALDGLLTEDERRTSSVEHHQAFRESISSPVSKVDPIDELVAELRQLNPEEIEP